MSPVSRRCLCPSQFSLIGMQIHDCNFRNYDFQSSFVFSLLPHEEVWHRNSESDVDYSQECAYDRLCIGVGNNGIAIALYDGEQIP